MKTKKTNISPWLHSIQHTFRTHDLFTTIGDYGVRIENTRKKINSILDKIGWLEEKMWGLHHSTHFRVTNDIRAIHDAIGVYGIYHPTHRKREREPNMLWYRYELSSEYKEGSEWWDYFGKDDGITDVGGYITVSLSDEGVSYLNEIAIKASFFLYYC